MAATKHCQSKQAKTRSARFLHVLLLRYFIKVAAMIVQKHCQIYKTNSTKNVKNQWLLDAIWWFDQLNYLVPFELHLNLPLSQHTL